MPRVIFHLDMDAFYASIEQRDHPTLKGKAVIVGGSPDRRGVVCAASYEARKFGVKSAMPSRTAGRLCPHGVFIHPRMDAYIAESRKIMELLAKFGGVIEQMSVDEAYLDMSEHYEQPEPDTALHAATKLGAEMKAVIFSQRQLPASIGIAANKLLAKIASGRCKPDGLMVVYEATKRNFLRPLPARAIHGVGKVTAQALASAGIETIADLQDYQGNLRALVGSFGDTLANFARGEDSRPLDVEGEVKSISSEETFDRDTENRRILVPALKTQAEEIAEKLRRERLAARTVQVKVRYGNFTTRVRQTSIEEPVESSQEIYRIACAILRRSQLIDRPVRLLGLGVSGLGPPSAQLFLPL